MKAEKNIAPFNGYLAAVIALVALLICAYGISVQDPIVTVASLLLFVFLIKGLIIIKPNDSKVLLLFGAYKGSIKQNGLFWINPFFSRTGLSLRARNFESEKIKVNDKMGNPILISVILVWRVENTFKATFEVDSYENF